MFLALFLQIELTPAQLMKILKGAGLTKLLVLVSPDVTPDLHNTMQYTTDHRVHWLNRLVVECTCISFQSLYPKQVTGELLLYNYQSDIILKLVSAYMLLMIDSISYL